MEVDLDLQNKVDPDPGSKNKNKNKNKNIYLSSFRHTSENTTTAWIKNLGRLTYACGKIYTYYVHHVYGVRAPTRGLIA